MGYRYFIAFVAKYENDAFVNHGNAIIKTRYRLEDVEKIEEIEEIEKTICEKHGIKSVGIINFIFLGTEEIEEDGDHIPRID